jgi:hypothetical protein
MSQLSRVARVLRRNTEYPGVTVAAIAKAAGVPKDIVHKRVYDLREEEGRTIYSNYRNRNGKRKMFYRIAG